ncbi:aspartyl/glutamyl-tRNA amidotransferase subunit C [Candidatus Kaiserbacteria bacterium]|nr:aspartyl/glutamyl-tRNA amidotransferase subunit C [Candidatus Kaiserbacteria bacterium]
MSKPHVDVAALASLARLEVSEEELARLEKEIPSILAFVETIQKATATAHPSTNVGLKNVMRADENPHESGIYTEKLLSAAPAREGNRVAVKQVLSRRKAPGTRQ